MSITTFKDDTAVEVLTVTAATAQIRVRAREYPAQSGEETTIRMTLEDGIPRTHQGAITLSLAVAGPGGLDTGVEAVSTWYTMWLIPHPTLQNDLSAVFSVQPPTGRPTGYPICRYAGCVRNDAAADLIGMVQCGDRSDYFQGHAIEAVAALDGAAVDVNLTAFVPSWASACTLSARGRKDAAAGVVECFFWQDDGAAIPAPRANPEAALYIDADAVVRERNEYWIAALTGGRGHIWRQRTSGGAAVLTNWTLATLNFWDPYVR